MSSADTFLKRLRQQPRQVLNQVKPVRIQLSRKKGWRMPPNTIKVDRTTKWGNPCIVGQHGTRAECVGFLAMALVGNIVLGIKCADGSWLADHLIAYRKMVKRDRRFLVGKNLACWCPLDAPCHADILLDVARTYAKQQNEGGAGS